MMGEVAPAKLIRSSGARPGDEVILTKGIAIEGAAIIAREKAAELKGEVPAAVLRRARRFLRDPGISVVRDAAIAARVGCHAMHDPTEGGLLMGAWELAEALKRLQPYFEGEHSYDHPCCIQLRAALAKAGLDK